MEQQCSSRQNKYISYSSAISLNYLIERGINRHTGFGMSSSVSQISIYSGNEIGIIFNTSDIDLCFKGSHKRHSVIPVETNLQRSSRRADRIFTFCIQSSFLMKFVTNKNEIYYSGAGMILDENFIPLIIIGVNVNTSVNTVKINPDVFMRNGTVENFIIKKLITFFIFGLNTGDRFGDKTIYLRRGRIDFHVDLCYNINEYITSTKTPNHYDMERVNSFLSEVSDDFVNYVKDVMNGNE